MNLHDPTTSVRRLARVFVAAIVLSGCWGGGQPSITAGDGTVLIGTSPDDRIVEQWMTRAVLGTIREDGLTFGQFVNERLERICPRFSPEYNLYGSTRVSDRERALVLLVSGFPDGNVGCLRKMEEYWQTLAIVDLESGRLRGVEAGEWLPAAPEPGAGWYGEFTGGAEP